MDPKVILLGVLIGMGFWTYEDVVKPVAVKTAHVVKVGAIKIGHVLRKVA